MKEKGEEGEFNLYKSGGNISLKSMEEMQVWIEACDMRYHDQFAVDERFDDKVLVMWTDGKGKSPLKSGSENSFDFSRLKQLNLEIFIHRGGSRYAKVLQITFHLSGKKHSVVVSGCSAHDWIDFEVPIVKSIIDMKAKGLSYKRIIQKSKKEDFTTKITIDPGKKVKTVNIHEVETTEQCNENTTSKEEQSSDVETCQQSSAKVHFVDSSDEESEEEKDDSESEEESIDSDESEYEIKEKAFIKEARENTKKNDAMGKSTTKKQLPQPKEKSKSTRKRQATKEGKEVIEDLKKEKNALKKRVAELEEKIGKLENKVYDLQEDNDICRAAYKREKKSRQYLEEIVDEMDEDNKSNESKKKTDEKKGSKEEEISKKMEFLAAKETEVEKKINEMMQLKRHQDNSAHQGDNRQFGQEYNEGYHQVQQERRNRRKMTPCRYEEERKGSCPYGLSCMFQHNFIQSFDQRNATNQQRDQWRQQGYCFGYMTGICQRRDCRFLHPGKSMIQTSQQQQNDGGQRQQMPTLDVKNMVQQEFKNQFVTLKKEIMEVIQREKLQQRTQSSWDPTISG